LGGKKPWKTPEKGSSRNLRVPKPKRSFFCDFRNSVPIKFHINKGMLSSQKYILPLVWKIISKDKAVITDSYLSESAK
jgi:hypothetical protein